MGNRNKAFFLVFKLENVLQIFYISNSACIVLFADPNFQGFLIAFFVSVFLVIVIAIITIKIFKVDIVLWYRNSCFANTTQKGMFHLSMLKKLPHTDHPCPNALLGIWTS